MPVFHPGEIIMEFKAVDFQLFPSSPNLGVFSLVAVDSGYAFHWNPNRDRATESGLGASVPLNDVSEIIVSETSLDSSNLRFLMNDTSRVGPFAFSIFTHLQLGHLIEYLMFKKLIDHPDASQPCYTVNSRRTNKDIFGHRRSFAFDPQELVNLDTHDFFLRKLHFAPWLPVPQPVSKSEFDAKQFADVRAEICARGLDPDLRPSAWAKILGVLPFSDDPDAIARQLEGHLAHYLHLYEQFELLTERQCKSNLTPIRDICYVIPGDVRRNDRHLPEYQHYSNPYFVVLGNTMVAYAMYNRDSGYVQGMTDMASYLIILFIKRWINADHSVFYDETIRPIREAEAFIFAALCGLFRITHQDRLFADMNLREDSAQRLLLGSIKDIAAHVHPLLGALLKSPDLESFGFILRPVLLLFKRELVYKDVLRLWDTIFTAEYPYYFPRFVGAAVLILSYPKLMLCKSETLREVMTVVDEVLEKTNVHSVIRLATALMQEIGHPTKPGMKDSVYMELRRDTKYREFRSPFFPIQ
jgi:hypothetical protein